MDGILSVFYFWCYMYISIFFINELFYILGDVGVYICCLLWVLGRVGLFFCYDWFKVIVLLFIIVLIKVIYFMFCIRWFMVICLFIIL